MPPSHCQRAGKRFKISPLPAQVEGDVAQYAKPGGWGFNPHSLACKGPQPMSVWVGECAVPPRLISHSPLQAQAPMLTGGEGDLNPISAYKEPPLGPAWCRGWCRPCQPLPPPLLLAMGQSLPGFPPLE